MTTLGPELVDPRTVKPFIYKGFKLDFFTGK
jgi:hypothetical protein